MNISQAQQKSRRHKKFGLTCVSLFLVVMIGLCGACGLLGASLAQKNQIIAAEFDGFKLDFGSDTLSGSAEHSFDFKTRNESWGCANPTSLLHLGNVELRIWSCNYGGLTVIFTR